MNEYGLRRFLYTLIVMVSIYLVIKYLWPVLLVALLGIIYLIYRIQHSHQVHVNFFGRNDFDQQETHHQQTTIEPERDNGVVVDVEYDEPSDDTISSIDDVDVLQRNTKVIDVEYKEEK